MLFPGDLVRVLGHTKLWYTEHDVGVPPCDIYAGKYSVGLVVAAKNEWRSLLLLLIDDVLAWTYSSNVGVLPDDQTR